MRSFSREEAKLIPATCPDLDTPQCPRKRIWEILDEFKAGNGKPGQTARNLDLRRIGRRFPAILIEETNADLANAVPATGSLPA